MSPTLYCLNAYQFVSEKKQKAFGKQLFVDVQVV